MPPSSIPSPLSNRTVSYQMRSPMSDMMASSLSSPMSTKKLPLPPTPPPPRKSHPRAKTVAMNKQSYSPSLVQFSCQQKRSKLSLNLFSIFRFALVAAASAGIPFCVIQARSGAIEHLHSNILQLVFLAFSLVLSTLDIIQFYYSKLPYRVEAMLDLLLAFSFLSFFLVGMLGHRWNTSIVFFVVSGLHFSSFFNIIIRAHQISQQLQQLSTLTVKDIERADTMKMKRASTPTTASSTQEPPNQHRFSVSQQQRRTTTETITAIRSPCAELEGSNRWTIIAEKPVDCR